MTRKSWLPVVAVAALTCMGTGGCEKAEGRKAIVLNPTTRQNSTAPTHEPPPETTAPSELTTKPTSTTRAVKVKQSHIQVNGIWFDFPPAKLTLRKEGDQVRAMLCSNDPPEVISPAYAGNRYAFEMTLDSVDNVHDISTADFVYHAPSQEPQETPNGIFLEGDRQQLQPYEIRVVFEKKDDQWVAEIQGTFIRVTKGAPLGEQVGVSAFLAAKAEIK